MNAIAVRAAGSVMLVACACASLTGCTRVFDGHPLGGAHSVPTAGTSRSTPGNSTGPAVPPATPTTTVSPAPVARVYRITTDRTGFVVTTRLAGTSAQTRVPGLSWSKTFAPGSGTAPVVSATADPSAGFIECTVTVDGVLQLRTRAGGPGASIQCS